MTSSLERLFESILLPLYSREPSSDAQFPIFYDSQEIQFNPIIAMADSVFTIFIHSANDLRKVKLSSKMNVYAVASVSGDPRNGNQETKTPIVKDGGTNPQWKSHPINFTVFKEPLLHNQLTLNIKLFSERTFGDTTIGKANICKANIGEAKIPLKELFDMMGRGDAQKKQIKHVSRGVQPQGTINFGYIFGDEFWVPEPQNNSQDAGAYPPAQAHSYPPPGAYAPPPQAGYVYGGYQPGHGYGQQVLQGGFLIAGISNDVVQMAAAYDAGFGG